MFTAFKLTSNVLRCATRAPKVFINRYATHNPTNLLIRNYPKVWSIFPHIKITKINIHPPFFSGFHFEAASEFLRTTMYKFGGNTGERKENRRILAFGLQRNGFRCRNIRWNICLCCFNLSDLFYFVIFFIYNS